MRFVLATLLLISTALVSASFITKKLSSAKPKKWTANVAYVQFNGSSPLIRAANREIEKEAKSILANFLSEAKANKPKARACTLDTAAVVHLDSASVLSVHFGMNSYLGGAHTNVNFATINFGIVGGRPARLKAADLVTSTSEFAKQISAGLNSDLHARGAAPMNFNLTGKALDSFVISHQGIEFMYDQAPHAVGSLFAELPWKSIKGLNRNGPVKAIVAKA